MKMLFEQPKSLPAPTEKDMERKYFTELKTALVKDRAKLVAELADVQDLAQSAGVDLSNDYDARLNSESYESLRATLLARQMAITRELELSEEIMDDTLESLGESRQHDA